MKYEDALWRVMSDAIKEKINFLPTLSNNKIIVPTTGGLDSRIAAGMMSRVFHYKMPWTYWFRCPDNERNEPHIKSIANILNTELFIIDVPKLPDGFRYGTEQLNKKVNLKDYRILVPFHMDVMAGMLKSRRKERKYFLDTYKDMEEKFWYNYVLWGAVSMPFSDSRMIGYFLSLPRSQRLFERAYIRMLNKYLPELASVPRCFEKGTGNPIRIDKGIFYYAIFRIIDKIPPTTPEFEYPLSHDPGP